MKHWLFLAFAILLVTILAGQSGTVEEFLHTYGRREEPAILVTNVYAHDGTLNSVRRYRPGEYFFVHYKIERYRSCMVTIQFRLTLTRPGDNYPGLASYSYPQAMYYGPPASLETNEYFAIPIGMPPGH